ncbi:MAG: hypothetical protein M4579_001706 [Chaenotheca gracillima]|nr:MAG: hypothetical protein M4579_001706 [Chaenotheca gracillima]
MADDGQFSDTEKDERRRRDEAGSYRGAQAPEVTPEVTVNVPREGGLRHRSTASTSPARYPRRPRFEKIDSGVPTVRVATLSPPLGQFVINIMIQLAGFAAAIAFGIFAVRSVSLSNEAIQQANLSNQVALLSICVSSAGTLADLQISELCSQVLADAALILPAVVSSSFPKATTTTPTSRSTTVTGSPKSGSPSSVGSGAGLPSNTIIGSPPTTTTTVLSSAGVTPAPAPSPLLSTGSKIGIGIGAAVGGLVLLGGLGYLLSRTVKRRSKRNNAPMTAPAPLARRRMNYRHRYPDPDPYRPSAPSPTTSGHAGISPVDPEFGPRPSISSSNDSAAARPAQSRSFGKSFRKLFVDSTVATQDD